MIINTLIFLISFTMILFSSYFLMALLKPKFGIDYVLSIFTLLVSQIIFTVLLSGVVFHSLNSITVLAVNFSILLISYFTSKRQIHRYSTASIRNQISVYLNDIKASPFTMIIGSLAIAEMCWVFFLIYLFPVYDVDGLLYHLPTIAGWIKQGYIGDVPFTIWSNVYPNNTEVVLTWVLILLKSDMFLDAIQLIFGIFGALAVIGLAREIGISRPSSLFAGCMFFLTPIVLVQAKAAYVDLVFASMFLIFFYFCYRFIKTLSYSYSILAGLSGGVMLGIKGSSPIYLLIPAIFLLIAAIVSMRQKKCSLKLVLYSSASFIFLSLLLGSYWFFKNWFIYGNPVYPFNISLLGKTVFPGIMELEESIMIPNTPESLLNKPMLEQIWIAWKSEPQIYIFDQRLGGFGLQWLVLEFPALILLSIYSLIRKRKLFFYVIFPFLLIFVLQTTNWWSRYTIFFVGIGSISLAYILELIKQRFFRHVLQFICFFLVVLSMYFSSTQTYYTPNIVIDTIKLNPSERTLGNVFDKRYGWIDKLTDGYTIGYTQDILYAYGVFGTQLKNTPVFLENLNKQQFLQIIKEKHIDYIFTTDKNEAMQWSQEENFQLIDSTLDGRVFKVN